MILGRLLTKGKLCVFSRPESSLELKRSLQDTVLELPVPLNQLTNANAIHGDHDYQQNKRTKVLEPGGLPEVRLHHHG